MGFDLNGIKPTNKKGEYFRNNVWWWRPLWKFIGIICPDIISNAELDNGEFNDGLEFDNIRAIAIATRIQKSIKDKTAKKFANKIKKENKKLKSKFSYPFTVTNLKEFEKFCRNSGGFSIN